MRLLTCRSVCAATDTTIIVLLGEVAIRTVLPSIFTSLTRIANSSDPLKLALNEISYKPFISLFNLTGASAADPSIAGIVDYASAVALELYAGAGDVAVYYVREPAERVGLGSAVECWVDDNYAGAVVLENAAQVGEPTPT